MLMNLSERIEEIKAAAEVSFHRMNVAMEIEPADLLLKNANVVNVFTGEILKTDVAISGQRIAAVRPDISEKGVSQIIDCSTKYAVPGYLEPHMHVETTLVSPRQLARVLTPLGTTTLFADGTDVSYVAGVKSVRTLMDATKNIPLRFYLEAPSYSAYLPEVQTIGGEIGLQEVVEMSSWPETVSLGEVVATKVLAGDREYIEKITAYKMANKRINGHTAVDKEIELDGFITTGITDDHTVNSVDQILPRLRRGMTLFLVEAPGRRFLGQFLEYIKRNNIPTDRICFCIDNTTIIDMVDDDYGYMDYLVELAVKSGIDPVSAIQMATINTARYFKLDGDIGSISPGRFADILLLDSLDHFRPSQVVFEGKLVAENGKLLNELEEIDYPEEYLNSIHLHKSLSKESLNLTVSEDTKKVKVRVLELPAHDEQAGNLESSADLEVTDGVIQVDVEQDVVYLKVVERYGKTGNVGHGFCKGTKLKEGAIATSLSISDSNIVVLGCDHKSMWTAIKQIKKIQGGIAIANQDQVLYSVSLPLGGQISDAPYEELLEAMKKVKKITESLGSTLKNPALTLASTVLMSIPDLGLTDAGYVNAYTGNLISAIISEE